MYVNTEEYDWQSKQSEHDESADGAGCGGNDGGDGNHACDGIDGIDGINAAGLAPGETSRNVRHRLTCPAKENRVRAEVWLTLSAFRACHALGTSAAEKCADPLGSPALALPGRERLRPRRVAQKSWPRGCRPEDADQSPPYNPRRPEQRGGDWAEKAAARFDEAPSVTYESLTLQTILECHAIRSRERRPLASRFRLGKGHWGNIEGSNR